MPADTLARKNAPNGCRATWSPTYSSGGRSGVRQDHPVPSPAAVRWNAATIAIDAAHHLPVLHVVERKGVIVAVPSCQGRPRRPRAIRSRQHPRHRARRQPTGRVHPPRRVCMHRSNHRPQNRQRSGRCFRSMSSSGRHRWAGPKRSTRRATSSWVTVWCPTPIGCSQCRDPAGQPR